ncbi:hypothetical protein [Benzoatithermus flavus]|uniref:Uncharacterized protein n=1 Tax=Benzoatithermus flavus TaxID=3108223 RepID=A0ABU8XR56_9PROT
MARGRNNDRSRSAAPSGRSRPADPSGHGSAPENEAKGRRVELARYETVEFEEIDEPGGAGGVRARTAPAAGADDVAADRRNHAMSQPEDTSPATPTAAEGGSSPDLRAADSTAPRRRGGTGFLAGLIGGLLGTAAVLAGGGWYAYEYGPLKPALGRFEAAETAARNAEAGVGRLGDQLGQLRGDLDGLKTALQGTNADLQKTNAAIAALNDRVAASEKATSDLAAASEKARSDLAATVEQASTSFRKASEEVIGRLEAVNAKLVEVEQHQPADVVDKGTVAAVAQKQAAIDQSQAKLEGALSRLEQLVAQGLEAGNQQAAALRTVVDATRSRLDELVAGQRELMALKDQMAQQGEAIRKNQAAFEELGQRIAAVRGDLERQLRDVTDHLTTLDAQRERSVGLSIAVHDIETAIQNGQPFEPALETLTQLGQGDDVVAAAIRKLQPVADSGVVSSAELARRLAEIEAKLKPTPKEQPKDWLERTRQNLTGLVSIHPEGEEAVPGLNAVRAATRALEAQDLPGAVSALEPLAQAGNRDAVAWIDAARQRLAAREALEALQQHVKTLLAQQG